MPDTTETKTRTEQEPPLMLTMPKARKRYGLGKDAMRHAIESGTIPYLKIGRRLMVPRERADMMLLGAD